MLCKIKYGYVFMFRGRFYLQFISIQDDVNNPATARQAHQHSLSFNTANKNVARKASDHSA